MTASVGFRAPSSRAMISEFAEYIANQTSEALRYSDPDIQQQSHPAEINATALNAIKKLLDHKFVIDETQLRQWFGEYMTDARSSNQLTEIKQNISDFDTLKQQLSEQDNIQQSPFSRFLYSHTENGALLFVDGQSYSSSKDFAEMLCKNHTINMADIFNTISTVEDETTFLELYNRGCID